MGAPKPPSNIVQTNKVELGPEQKKVFDLAFPHIAGYAASTPQVFSGSGVAPFTPLEEAAQAGYVGTAAGVQGLANQAGSTQQQLLDPSFMLDPNQYIQNAAGGVTNQVTKNLMETVLPGIRSGSTVAGGQYSGGATRQGVAEGKAIGDTNQALSNSLADMYLKNYQHGMTSMINAMQMNPSVMQQQLMPWDILGAVGGQQRGLQQATLDEEIAKFYAQQDMPLLQSQQLLNLIAGMPGGTGVSTVQGAMPKTNPMMQGLGLVSSLAGLFGGGPIGLGAGMLK